MATTKRKVKSAIDPKALLALVGTQRITREYDEGQAIFSQGDRAEAVFFIDRGKVKLTVLSRQGKQAVIALLGPETFFGEGCLAGQPLRMSTATATTDCSIALLPKPAMLRALHEDAKFAETFTTYLLSRNIRMEEDLVDQLFNSSEKRLARILLLLANFGKAGHPEPVVPKISQETLAEMVGTTRSRISHFMNKFRKLGFVEYNGRLEVHSSLLHVVLHD
jgi:CRP/FNR family transcriptional regulator, cyclic AMP receptor protein